MGRDFSFQNVRIFAQAYLNFLKQKYEGKDLSLIVNYDTRFLSKQFALEASKLFSLHGVKTYIPNRDAPLAAISLAIIKNKFNGGVNFTASFNKPIFNGIKVFNHKGAPSLPSETLMIEREASQIYDKIKFKPQYANNELMENIDVRGEYINYIEDIINFDLIKESGMVIVVDNLYGASREYLDYVLDKNQIEIMSIHNFPYSSVGAVIPSCNSENLRELSELVCTKNADIGLATDIDGDRFGIVDSKGKFIDANMIMPPLIEYLITVRKMAGGIVKSISTTNNIKKVADYYLRKVYSTPVGFKYLADMLSRRKAFIAVESTNGASLNTNITIKDGILFNLLVTEMLAYYKLDMGKVLGNFYLKFPKLYNKEITINKNKLVEESYNKLLSKKDFNLGDFDLQHINYTDGIKFISKDSWLLLRESGTNNVIRIYAESPRLKITRKLIKTGRNLLEN